MEEIFADFSDRSILYTVGKEPHYFMSLEEARRRFLELPFDLKVKSHIKTASGQVYLPDAIPRLRRRLRGEGTE